MKNKEESKHDIDGSAGLSYRVRLRLMKDEQPFYGKGVSELLQLTEEKGSLRAASMEMNMAYSKAMRMIKNAEAALGYKILKSSIGGVSGGGSSLTAEGAHLLERYQKMEKELEDFCRNLVTSYFQEEGF